LAFAVGDARAQPQVGGAATRFVRTYPSSGTAGVAGGGGPDLYSLTHHWTMDEASGDRLDSIGGYTFSEQGVPVLNEAGQISNASVHAAAANNQLEGADVEILPTGAFTISCWFKSGATNGTGQIVFHQGTGTTVALNRFYFLVNNGRTSVVFTVSSGSASSSPQVFHTITLGTYYLFAARRSAANVWDIALWDGTTWTAGDTTPTVVLNPTVGPFAVGASTIGTFPANVSVDSIKLWAEYVPLDIVLRYQS
jgi:hypothetical protein